MELGETPDCSVGCDLSVFMGFFVSLCTSVREGNESEETAQMNSVTSKKSILPFNYEKFKWNRPVS